MGYSQYYYNYSNTDPSLPAAGNPGGLNTTNEFPVGGGLDASWTTIQGSSATPVWSPTQTIPFGFNFNGSPVTQYKVSTSGVLTFDVAASAVPPGANTNLPSASIPNSSVLLWGLAGTGANDNIVTQTFGTAPNRQHWVFFSSYNYDGGAAACWHYFSIVLEESTDNIYIVDQRKTTAGGCTPSLTLGIQIDGTTATEVFGSPNYAGFSESDASDVDNVYFAFIQGVRPDYDMVGKAVNLSTWSPIADAPFSFSGRVENAGAITVTSFDLNYSINGGTPVVTAISNTNLTTSNSGDYTINSPWTPPAVGTYEVAIWASNINGNADLVPANDTVTKTVNVIGPFVPRRLLHEDFTSSSCAPCLPGGIQLRSVIGSFPDTASTLISYPMTWPSTGDPYHTAEANTRRQYYGVSAIPNIFLDGGYDGNPGSYTTQEFQAYQEIPSFVSIDATFNVDSIAAINKKVTVNVTLNPLQNYNSTFLRLHVAIFEVLTENNASTDFPNGETEWHHYLKKMLPDANGLAIPPLVANTPYTAQTQSYSFLGDYRLPPNSINPINLNIAEHSVEEFTDLGVVVFIQDQNTKEILQSAYATVACNPIAATFNTFPDNGTGNGKAKVLTTTGGVGYTYSLNGIPFSGDSLMGLSAGTYPVTITDGYGCTATQDVTVQSNVSIEDDMETAGINLFSAYPNPSNGNFAIQLELDQVEDLEVRLYDVNGRIIFEETQNRVRSYRKDVSLNDVASGMYFLVARTSKGSATQRLSIK